MIYSASFWEYTDDGRIKHSLSTDVAEPNLQWNISSTCKVPVCSWGEWGQFTKKAEKKEGILCNSLSYVSFFFFPSTLINKFPFYFNWIDLNFLSF